MLSGLIFIAGPAIFASAQTTDLTSQSAIPCLDIKYDLFFGQRDSTTDQSIYLFQQFLSRNGYLFATPNGYFGNGTKTAVQAFQAKKGITSTGRVGPLTRKIIKDMTCGKVNTSPVAATSSVPQPTIAPVVQQITVTSPAASSTMASGSDYFIQWANSQGSIYNIVLEDKYGVGGGIIASSISGNSYTWEAGKAYSSRAGTVIMAPPGVYRIHLQSILANSMGKDQYSGLFTLESKPVRISSILPQAVSNNGKASAALYGSGFDSASRVLFDDQNTGRYVRPSYVSPDGKILVFNVPSYVSEGPHVVMVRHVYDSDVENTPSNIININITSITN